VPVRDSIHNVLTNLDKPVLFGNDVLQGQAVRASETLERFTLNSTLAWPASSTSPLLWAFRSFRRFRADAGRLGRRRRPYLVIPLMGPSSPRDLAGDVGDIFMDPLTYVKFHGSDTWYAVRSGVGVLDLARA